MPRTGGGVEEERGVDDPEEGFFGSFQVLKKSSSSAAVAATAEEPDLVSGIMRPGLLLVKIIFRMLAVTIGDAPIYWNAGQPLRGLRVTVPLK